MKNDVTHSLSDNRGLVWVFRENGAKAFESLFW